MFCPNCRSEFREGYTRCTRCKLDLVESLPEEPVFKKATAMQPVLLRAVSDQLEAGMLAELLRRAGIPCLLKYREAGGYLNISMGASVFGEDIYVDAVHLPAAQALLADWDDRHLAAEPEDDMPEPKTPYFKRRGAAARVVLLLNVLMAIVYILYAAILSVRSLLG